MAMINGLSSSGARRTSWIDRAWANHYSVLLMSPVERPSVPQLKADLLDFMAADATNPVNCVLSADGRRWVKVNEAARGRHLDQVVVATGPFDADDPYDYIRRYAPAADARIPYKVLIGPDSLTCFVSHVLGDAVTVVSLGVLLTLGDVHGLRYLRPDSGMGVAVRLLSSEVRSHYKSWWRHFRGSSAPGAPSIPAHGRVSVPAQISTDAVWHRVSPKAIAAMQDWRRDRCPEVSTSGLVAAAAYRALTRHGVELNPNGCYTLIDLRRHLPPKQALRSGNLVKSLFIPAQMAEPSAIGAAISEAVASARAIPALTIGGLSAGLRSPSQRSSVTEICVPTMTFNYMMRLPGVDHIPWQTSDVQYFTTMSYPCTPDNLALFACGVDGAVHLSASFVPEIIDRSAVQRALRELDDMPALLSTQSSELNVTG